MKYNKTEAFLTLRLDRKCAVKQITMFSNIQVKTHGDNIITTSHVFVSDSIRFIIIIIIVKITEQDMNC